VARERGAVRFGSFFDFAANPGRPRALAHGLNSLSEHVSIVLVRGYGTPTAKLRQNYSEIVTGTRRLRYKFAMLVTVQTIEAHLRDNGGLGQAIQQIVLR